ncbi:MAG: hypothetical protein SGI92_03845 [Bryobacteraceae bacterium]|nr:hypothetical protein [Bryobacteraceae bacterium]
MLLLAFAALMSNALLEVPPARWVAVDLPIPQHNTTVEGQFEVIHGSRVQVLIAARSEAERLQRGRSFRPIFSSGFQNDGRIRLVVPEAGDYVLLVDNRIEGRFATKVRLSVQTSNSINVQARELTPTRRRTVIAASLLFFGSVLVFSAWQFLRWNQPHG